MDWLSDINWFAIHTKRFREALAALSIGALGIEVFLPMVKVECPEHEIIKVGSKALFSGYVFARFIPMISLGSVESARGVLHVIKSGMHPIPVDDRIISEIQSRISSDGLIRLGCREFKIGDCVSIQKGPFAGMMGKVQAEVDDRKRVAILLESLWSAQVLIEKRWVEATC
jgi:transcriptional antiterminator RfaH